MICLETFCLDVAYIQKEYENLKSQKKLTKKAICDLCVPFRDKYGLTDIIVLSFARKEKTPQQIMKIYMNLVV